MKIHTLNGSDHLTKIYTIDSSGKINTNPYPNLSRFTSHEHDVTTLEKLYIVISAAGKEGHCLLKGNIKRPLNNESRAGATSSTDSTKWVCLDLDDSPYTDPNVFMKDIGLEDISYICQYSASYGIKQQTLGCHIFMLLDEPVKASILKLWLQTLNLNTPTLKSGIRLTKSGVALHWPVDITCCQNDKLIYIADPLIMEGIATSFPPKWERVVLHRRPLHRLPISRLGHKHQNSLNAEIGNLRNGLRTESHLAPLRKRLTQKDGNTIQAGLTDIVVTEGPQYGRGYEYFNLNGGDSWGYYLDPNDPKYLRNFKGEPWLLTEEVMPEYYAELLLRQKQEVSLTSSEEKVPIVLNDLYTATYYRGYIHSDTQTYTLFAGRSSQICENFMEEHNKKIDFIPTWKLRFEPTNLTRIDIGDRFLNLWKPTKFYLNELSDTSEHTHWPTINTIINHLCANDESAIEWLTNWMAFIIQKRKKTGVAILSQTVEGAGKGTLINHVLRPLLGPEHVVLKKQSDLQDSFNDWLKTALIVGIDEAEIGILRDGNIIQSDLKTYITEPLVTIRAPFASSIACPNYTNFFLATNKPMGAMLGSSDRRFTVLPFQNKKIRLNRQDIEETIPAELTHFFSHLMQYEINEDLVHTPLQNEARNNLIELSKTTAQVLADALLKGDVPFLLDQLPDEHIIESQSPQGIKAAAYKERVENILQSIAKGAKEIKLTRDELFTIFDYCIGNMPVSPTKFAQFLHHKGILIQKIRFGEETKRGISIATDFTKEEATKHMTLKPRKLRLV